MKSNYIIALLIIFFSILPFFLFAQSDGGNTLGGRYRLQQLNYQKSPLGATKDIDIELRFNYIKDLFPLNYRCNQANRCDTIMPGSYYPFGIGMNIGVKGYYNNTDSLNMHETNICLGPILRYYTAKCLFFEMNSNIFFSRSKIWNPNSGLSNQDLVPVNKIIGINFEIGLGYRIKLSENILFEPLIAFQRVKTSWYYKQIDYAFMPYENINNINIYLSLQLYY